MALPSSTNSEMRRFPSVSVTLNLFASTTVSGACCVFTEPETFRPLRFGITVFLSSNSTDNDELVGPNFLIPLPLPRRTKYGPTLCPRPGQQGNNISSAPIRQEKKREGDIILFHIGVGGELNNAPPGIGK